MSGKRAMKWGLLVAIGAAGGVFAAESVYTDLDIDNCKVLVEPNPDEPGGDFISELCKGYGDYPVLFKEGDVRQSVHYGFLKKSIVDGAFETFGTFNHMNPKIEWRIGANGKPIAAIQRFFIENSNPDTGSVDSKLAGQVLVVSKVGQPGEEEGCVVAYVDALANHNANAIARDMADTLVPSFRCGIDKADYHGSRGDLASDPTSYLGQD